MTVLEGNWYNNGMFYINNHGSNTKYVTLP
jgi:hypothetical protein